MTTEHIVIDWRFDAFTFGRTLKGWRRTANMSQADIGAYIGRSGQFVSSIERGDCPGLQIRDMVTLCNMFDVSPSDFFELDNGLPF